MPAPKLLTTELMIPSWSDCLPAEVYGHSAVKRKITGYKFNASEALS